MLSSSPLEPLISLFSGSSSSILRLAAFIHFSKYGVTGRESKGQHQEQAEISEVFPMTVMGKDRALFFLELIEGGNRIHL